MKNTSVERKPQKVLFVVCLTPCWRDTVNSELLALMLIATCGGNLTLHIILSRPSPTLNMVAGMVTTWGASSAGLRKSIPTGGQKRDGAKCIAILSQSANNPRLGQWEGQPELQWSGLFQNIFTW